MAGNYKYRFIPGMLSLMLMLPLFTGCIAEEFADCSVGIPFTVSLPAGTLPETVKDMSLYVFDDKNLLLDVRPVNAEEPLMLDYPDIPVLHCVALCNTSDPALFVSPLKKGDHYSGGFVSLVPATRAGEDIYAPPADLFSGAVEIENPRTSYHPAGQRLEVARRSASMNITLRGLQQLTGSEDTDYSLVIGETCSRMDFNGAYVGPPASYSPPLALTENRDFTVSMLRLFPAPDGAGLTVDIYHRNVLFKSVRANVDGHPIVPVVGKTTNILLNFTGAADVEIEITGWGESHIWKEYN